jgi:hypothetical protein
LKVWTKTQGTIDDLKITDTDFPDFKVQADTVEIGLIPYILESNSHPNSFIRSFIYYSFLQSIQGHKEPKGYRTCRTANAI